MPESEFTAKLHALLVDLVDFLIPKPPLRLLNHPKFHAFVGPERIEAVGAWIDNTFMLKRQRIRIREARAKAYYMAS